MSTEIRRIPLLDQSGLTLEQRIQDACTVMDAAGYQLKTSFALGCDLILIFQINPPTPAL